MTKLLLDVALVDLGTGGKASAKGMTEELEGALGLAEIAANAGGYCTRA
jgi:hypothetical protein